MSSLSSVKRTSYLDYCSGRMLKGLGLWTYGLGLKGFGVWDGGWEHGLGLDYITVSVFIFIDVCVTNGGVKSAQTPPCDILFFFRLPRISRKSSDTDTV